ncbi:uncharacterized protein LOC130649144 [Hydractinia symbiolongicarpus]|uniref:uncharacterized protein LOC130649144 n=1 Tax=Hydractinia symbiolongicarpus TaxID=13093 RepID=UPI00254BC2E6|nr:uncharacterized protein LOC130649144 [Hydractinia symbiolongicarpus]
MITVGVKFFLCVLIGRPFKIFGDVQSYIGFPTGYGSHSNLQTLTTSGYTSRLQCVKMCYNQKFGVSFAVNSATFNDKNNYCWCGRNILTSFDTSCCLNNIFNYIPVYGSVSSNARLGGSLSIFVSAFLRKRGNDKIVYFAFEDMNAPYNASRSVTFLYSKTATKTEIKHPATKQTYKILEEIGETNVEMLNPHYHSDIQIVDNDNHSSNSFWIATIRENDAMVVVDTNFQYNITRPAASCLVNILVSDGKLDTDSGDFVVDIELTTKSGCNKNVEDVSISLYNEVYLEPYEVETQHTNTCIPETSLEIKATYIQVKYWRLFMYRQICIRVRYRHSGVNMGGGSKRTTVLADIFYTGFKDNLSMTYSFHREYRTYLSKNVNGFLLWTANQELCASYYFQDLSLRKEQCAVFKHIPYNIQSLFGLCSYKFSSALTKEGYCNQTKRLSGETTALRWLDDGTYVNLAGSEEAKVGSSNVEVPFLRQHIKSFGVKHNVKKFIDRNSLIDDVSLLWNGHDVFVCNYVNHRFYRCIIYKKEIYRVTPLPPLFASVLGYDKKRRITIGFSKERRYVGFRAKGKYKSFYLSPNYWSKLEGTENLVLAKSFNRSLLNVSRTEEEKFEVGSDVYTVTPLGLYHDAEQQHIIVWYPNGDCKSVVGSSEVLAFSSCAELKEYCPTAENGTYWIGSQQKLCTMSDD